MIEQKIYNYLNLFFIALVAVWLGFSFSASIFPDNITVQLITKYIYGQTCHQITERSFCIDNKSMHICSRCFGIYFGLFTGLILFSLKKIFTLLDKQKYIGTSYILWLFIIPFIIDIFLSKLSIYDSGNVIRFISGFLLLIPLSFLITSSLSDLSKEIIHRVYHAK